MRNRRRRRLSMREAVYEVKCDEGEGGRLVSRCRGKRDLQRLGPSWDWVAFVQSAKLR